MGLDLVNGILLYKRKDRKIGYRDIRRPAEDRGRDWSAFLQAKEFQGLLITTRAKREAWNRFSFRASRKSQYSHNLEFRLPASRDARQYTSVVFKPSRSWCHYSSLRK